MCWECDMCCDVNSGRKCPDILIFCALPEDAKYLIMSRVNSEVNFTPFPNQDQVSELS